jgi:hypothetical protein
MHAVNLCQMHAVNLCHMHAVNLCHMHAVNHKPPTVWPLVEPVLPR